MNWPKISVIIPSYNQGRFIKRTIQSVQKQNYNGDREIIVSDGGSTDETVEVLKALPNIQWWSEKDRGFADAVNKGLNVATGDIVAIQSSDDFYLQNAFRDAALELARHPQCVMVSGGEVRINEKSEVVHIQKQLGRVMPSPLGMLMWETYIPQHGTFMRRGALEKLGGLRESVDWCADFDLFYRLLHLGPAVFTPVLYGVYQLHAEQRTQRHPDRWVKALMKCVQDAEENPSEPNNFRLDAAAKKYFEVRHTLYWYETIGGASNLSYAKRFAVEVASNESTWHAPAKDAARAWLKCHRIVPGIPPVLSGPLLFLERFRSKAIQCARRWWRYAVGARTTNSVHPKISRDEVFWCHSHKQIG